MTKVLLKGVWWIIDMIIQCKTLCGKCYIRSWSRGAWQWGLSCLLCLHEALCRAWLQETVVLLTHLGCSSSWIETGHLTQNPPDEDQVHAHLLISVVLGISWCSWESLRHSRAKVLYFIFTIPALGRDLMAAMPCQFWATPSGKHKFHPLQL